MGPFVTRSLSGIRLMALRHGLVADSILDLELEEKMSPFRRLATSFGMAQMNAWVLLSLFSMLESFTP